MLQEHLTSFSNVKGSKPGTLELINKFGVYELNKSDNGVGWIGTGLVKDWMGV